MLSELMTKKLTKHFQFQDSNDDGFVEKTDWEQCAKNLATLQNWDSDSAEYKSIVDKHLDIWRINWQPADTDSDGKVSLKEYLELADQLSSAAKPLKEEYEDQDDEEPKKPYLDRLLELFGAIFDSIDHNSDGNIDLDNYKNYFRAWGVDESLAKDAFVSMDLNGDGIIRRMSFIQFGSNFFLSDMEGDFGNLLFGPLEEKKMNIFSMQHERNGDVTILAITGRVDSATSKTIDAELTKLIPAEKKVVLDLKDVEFLSSAGVRAIVKALKTAKKSRGGLKVASIPDHIAEVLQTLGMMELMETYPSADEAVASF